MPTSSGSHGRVSRPPARYPAVEPPTPSVAALPIPLPAVDNPPPKTESSEKDPYGEVLPPTAPAHPQLEAVMGIPPFRSIASSEEVMMARFRELEYEIRHAVDRAADSEHRLSLVEAELTRFRDIEHTAAEALARCAAVEARLAVAERLATPSQLINKPAIGVSQDGNPLGGRECSSNLLRESVDPQGRHGKVRIGQRDKKRREKVEHSLTSSENESGTTSSEDDPIEGIHPARGPAVPGLREIIPSRSDYKLLVSYRTYRLENRSPRYDKTVTAKLSSYVKRLKHAVEDRFGGDEPIEILAFLRTFKEAADHNDVGEGAAARLIPYFLKDAAKEGYRAHMDETPVGMMIYPYMVQYLLETYALDDELAKAYLTVSTAKQLDGEDERAFGRRLQRAAIRAGNVINKRDLKTIYVEGLPPFVQAGLRMHLKPELTFEEVIRLAHNLGVSLRQTMLQPTRQADRTKVPPGVKALLTRMDSVNTVETESGEPVVDPTQAEEASLQEVEVALAHAHLAQAQARDSATQSSGRPTWRSSYGSPSPSVVSVPTRGWVSPGGSVMSEPQARQAYAGPPRVGVAKATLCFLCYKQGHMLAECPRLPSTLQQEARQNRQTWQRSTPFTGTRPGSPVGVVANRSMSGVVRPPLRDTRPQPSGESAVIAVDTSVEEDILSNEVGYSQEAGNDLGGN